MPCNTKAPTIRWFYLTIGILSMLFAGILYSWSILKAPLADAFGWNASQLTMNFTLTMCFFCLGGVGGGLLARRLGTRLTIALGGALACIGFVLTARLDGSSLPMLYLSYGVITATGIGFAYNVVLSTVQAWFPDKKGTCSGALLMGFGASSLVLGSLADALIQNPAVGWRAAFLCLGVALGIVLVTAALLIRLPAPGTVLPQPKAAANRVQEDFESADYTTGQMLRRFTFWRAFLCIIFLAAMGNTVISFAKDLSLSVGASAALSTTLVGVLAVCNGLGRILTGALFDTLGRRRTMLLANGTAILAALVITLSIIVYGGLKLDWDMAEFAAMFLWLGIVVGLLAGKSFSDIAKGIVAGSKTMLGAVMIVGSARSIALILTDGGVMDTIVHVLAGGLDLVPTVLQAPAMFLICTVFNVFMASGSGQAAVMMPLLLPVADLVGMTRQTVILAFNFGDGFGNYIFPTSTALMGLIGAANIPYDRWMRFIGKIFLVWVLIGCILVAIAQFIHLA